MKHRGNYREKSSNSLGKHNKVFISCCPKSKDFSVNFVTRSRSLTFRSRIDRFPICSLATSVVEGDKIREQDKNNKKARTSNYEYSQQKSGGGNCSRFQQKPSAPAPSSVSVPSSRFQQDQKGRGSSSKFQGSVSGTSPTQLVQSVSGHRLRYCHSSKYGQGGNNGRAQSPTSAAQAGRLTQ
uniref:Uncharacterized protein n=1 Tax=Solanum tuberosum TaxID=4113 RepID=M1DUV2_SOLTU